MMTRGSRYNSLSGFLFLLSLLSISPLCTALVVTYPDNVGPFVDDLVFRVVEGDDQQISALINDEVDLIGEFIDPAYLPVLESAEDIEVTDVMRNGYGYLTIKTDKYPLNITDFRRAFAFALDKEYISDTIWGGLSNPQDSCVPAVSPWTIEGQLPYTYYEANVELGNQMLDAAGFADIDSDGWREAPDQSDFDILVLGFTSSPIVAETIGAAEEALRALHIDADSWLYDYYEYPYWFWYNKTYDIAFIGASFTTFDVDWLAYEFWSEYADEPFRNYPCWQNATYDSWREQLLHATDYDLVYKAAIEMQKIWVHACPGVICYENVFLSAHRTDRFEGHVNDAFDGVPSWWTNYRVHLKESEGGPFGGQFRWSTPLDLDSLNFMAVTSAYSTNVVGYLYDSLIIIDPGGHDIPWLAESYVIETHADNPGVPEGHTRFKFNIVRNATWTDGTPLTGEDVAFTLNYYREAPGNPYGADLSNMTAAFAPQPYTVVVEFETESFWHLHTFGYKPIIPKHVFEEIGPEAWNTWNPSPDDLVTSGPFVISDYVPGEYAELTYNPDYFRGADRTTPVLGHPSDFAYVQESTGNIIVWPAFDSHPANYTVYRNSTVYDTGAWAGGDITLDIDGLAVGVYNFTLCAFDTTLNSASDTVWVTVSATTTTSTETTTTSTAWTFDPLLPLSLGITAGSLTVIALVGGYIVFSRRRG